MALTLRCFCVLSVPQNTSQYLPKTPLKQFPSIGPLPSMIALGLIVWDIPFLFGKLFKHVATMYMHSSIINFGARLKGNPTQKHLVLSLTVRMPLSILGTCFLAAHISIGTEMLPSSFWNSLSAKAVLIWKPLFLNSDTNLLTAAIMSFGPRLYVIFCFYQFF